VLTRRDLVARSLLLVVGGVGCSSRENNAPPADDFASRFAQYEAAAEPNGDLAKVVWPGFVTEAGPDVKRLYEFQITHGELMRYMPCFCGCGQNAGHRSNRDCYVRQVKPDGSVVLDSMAPT
jgi:hypothetical protein